MKILIVQCKNCGKEYKTHKSRLGKTKYCSRKCLYEQTKKRMIGNNHWDNLVCKLNWFKNGHKGHSKPFSLKFQSTIYNKWREKILKRDEYKCSNCGSDNLLVVHHIKARKENEDKLMEDSNAITLCRSCHMALHKPKSPKNTKNYAYSTSN